MRYVLSFLLVWICGFAFAGERPDQVRDSDYRRYSQAQIELGRLLFYDRVLSGTYRVACATCHNHDRGSSNGFLLDPSKESAVDDLAINGLPIYDALKPSPDHAPPLFNLGAREFVSMFTDGRVTLNSDGSFKVPGKAMPPEGLRDILAVQALFPALADDELVGRVKNEIAEVAHQGNEAIWDALAKRIRDLPEYWPYVQAAYPKLKRHRDVTIVEIANAISAFVGYEWRADNSPFDRFLRGEVNALSAKQRRGLDLFYGKAQCSTCHSGAFQTDHRFHAVGLALWRFDEDLSEGAGDVRRGRVLVTNRPEDVFKMKTPSLRNVVYTAPYGHAGSYEKIEDLLQAHIDPGTALKNFTTSRSLEGRLHSDVRHLVEKMMARIEMPKVQLENEEFSDLLAFLEALSDEAGLRGRLGKPEKVPSNLVLD